MISGCSIVVNAADESILAGIWSNNCASNSAISIDRVSEKEYSLTLCSGTKCIPMPGFSETIQIETEPNIKIISQDKISIAGVLFEQCSKYSSPNITEYPGNDKIMKFIIGRWTRTHIVKKGRRRKSRGYWNFKPDGDLEMYPVGGTKKYIIRGHKIYFRRLNAELIHVFNITSISASELEIEIPSPKKYDSEIHEFKYTHKRIEKATLANKVLYRIFSNMNEISPREKDRFSVDLAGDYEQGTCEFRYFAPNGEYLEIYTQACYRKKGEDRVHIDSKKKYGKYLISFGSWDIKGNYILSNKTVVEYEGYPYSTLVGRITKEEHTLLSDDHGLGEDLNNGDWDNPLSINDIPGVYDFFKHAKEIYQNPPIRPRSEPDVPEKTELPTKAIRFLSLNTGDMDDDGIPNFADFDAGKKFIPIVVEIDKYKKGELVPIDLNRSYLEFQYSDSDPLLISIDMSHGFAQYKVKSGHLRLWRKDGNVQRIPKSANEGGDFLRANEKYPLKLFTFTKPNIIIVWVEAVNYLNDSDVTWELTEIYVGDEI